jgi:PAS domain-containing protein
MYPFSPERDTNSTNTNGRVQKSAKSDSHCSTYCTRREKAMFNCIDAVSEGILCKKVESAVRSEGEGCEDMCSKISKSIGQATFDDLTADSIDSEMQSTVFDKLNLHSPFAMKVEAPKATVVQRDIADIFPEITWHWNIPGTCASATVSLEPPYRFRAVNAAFEALTLFKSAELLGSSLRLLCGPDTDEKTLNRVFRRISRGDFSSNSRGPVSIYRKDGDDVPCAIRAFASPPPHGLAECTIAMQPFAAADATEQETAERQQAAAGCSLRPAPHRAAAHHGPVCAARAAAAMAAAAAAAAAGFSATGSLRDVGLL